MENIIGHGKSWKVMEKPWEGHGKAMGRSWKSHGKVMEKPWEGHGKVCNECNVM